MHVRRRALLAVVVAGTLPTLACTERVPLLSAATTSSDADEPLTPEDAGSPVDVTIAPADAREILDAEVDQRCQEHTQTVRLEHQSPEVVIAMDRSYSMFAQRPNGKSWWQMVRQELSTYMKANEGAIQFGYEEFPSRGSCERASGCCGSRVLVPPYLHHAWDVERQLRCDSTATGCFVTAEHSPSGDALARIRDFYDNEFEPSPDRFVLLITDGSPSCASNVTECDEAGRQAARLFSTDAIKTIVLPLGEEARASTCLETVAVAGQTRGQGATDFPWAADGNQLKEQLALAMATVEARACRFRLLRTDPKGREHLSLTVNYMPFPRDPTHKEGWDFDPPGQPEIQIYGSACTKLKFAQMETRAIRAQITCTQCGSQPQCQ